MMIIYWDYLKYLFDSKLNGPEKNILKQKHEVKIKPKIFKQK